MMTPAGIIIPQPHPQNLTALLGVAEQMRSANQANKIRQGQLAISQQLNPEKIKLMDAQIKSMENQGKPKPGTLGALSTQRMYYNNMVKNFGVNSVQALNSKNDLIMTENKLQSGIDRQHALTKSQPTRALTTPGKTLVEQLRMQTGRAPTGDPWAETATGTAGITPSYTGPITHVPSSQDVALSGQAAPTSPATKTIQTQFGEMPVASAGIPSGAATQANQEGLYRQKLISDEDARKRQRFAANVDNSFQFLNQSAPDALSYSHIGGMADLAGDKVKSMMGNTPKRYQNYLNFKKNVDLIQNQLQQFYGTSITPEKGKEIHNLINSISVFTNPKQAKDTLRRVEQIYQKERDTYMKASKSPEIYTKQGIDLTKNLDNQIGTQGASTSGTHALSDAELDAEIARRGGK